MEGKKDSREGGQGEAFIPSALPGDWLTMQSSFFSGDIQVWKGLKMWLRGIQSRCQGRRVTSTPTKTPAIGRTCWHTISCEPSNDKRFGSVSRYPFSEVTRGHFPQVWGQSHFFFFLPRSPKSLMLIKAECLISSRWSVNLNYLFVFLFTVSVCLQFFASSWKSVIRAHVSFWLESLPDEPSRWYVDDLLIYGF